MKAWLLSKTSDLSKEFAPLALADIPLPNVLEQEILIKVLCCGVCHTELDEIEGRTPPTSYPIIPGHQVVGLVHQIGSNSKNFKKGDRVGAAWIFSTCGTCEFCTAGMENLCPDFKATGRDKNGGYAEFMVLDERYAFKIPTVFSDAEAAPLLCAGAIGYRSLRLAGISNGQTLGLTGFGASGHLVLKLARYLFPKSEIFVFVRSKEEQEFALKLGATWAGDFSVTPPNKIMTNAIIDTTPVWNTVVHSLLHLKPGGRLVINAIRKETHDIDVLLKIRYQDHLWMEKEIKTVANIVRKDVDDFLSLAALVLIKPEIEEYPFYKANEAIMDIKHRHIKGAKVLVFD